MENGVGVAARAKERSAGAPAVTATDVNCAGPPRDPEQERDAGGAAQHAPREDHSAQTGTEMKSPWWRRRS